MQERNTTRRTVLSALGISLVGGLAGVAGAEEYEKEEEDGSSDDYRDHDDRDDHDGKEFPKAFSARLSGNEHVPPVETNAYGKATFEVSEDGSKVRFSVYLDCIRNVTQAHVHLGNRGEDGPVVAWLYPQATREPELVEGFFEGTLAKGTLTKNDLVGDLEGESLEVLAKRVLDRGAYVNVHTERHPEGEVRGQIETKGDVSERSEEAEGDGHEEDETADEETEEEGEADEEPEVSLSLGPINVGEGVSADDEFITLQNDGEHALDMDGFTLRDGPDGVVAAGTVSEFTFPSGFTLGAGDSVRVYTGNGGGSGDLNWGIGRQIWNQEGDTVVVRDADGNTVLEQTYGDRTASLVGLFMSLV